MGSLLSSPGKQAQQGASGLQGVDQNIINQIEQYTGQQQQAERGAIAGIGKNPYFGAAQQMSPAPYAVNPNQTQTFGVAGGPGVHLASAFSAGAGGAPPPWQPPGPRGDPRGPGGGGGDRNNPGGGGPPTPPVKMPPPWGGGARGHEPT